MILRLLSLEWYIGFGTWSGTQILELKVVLRFWSLEMYSGFEA